MNNQLMWVSLVGLPADELFSKLSNPSYRGFLDWCRDPLSFDQKNPHYCLKVARIMDLAGFASEACEFAFRGMPLLSSKSSYFLQYSIWCGGILCENDLAKEAIKYLTAARELATVDSLFFGDFMDELGMAYIAEEKDDLAVETLQQCIQWLMDTNGLPPKRILAMSHLAFAYIEMGKMPEAESLLLQCQQMITDAQQTETVAHTEYLANYGLWLLRQRKLEEAVIVYDQCLKIQSALFGPTHHRCATTELNIGSVLFRLGRVEEASLALQKSCNSLKAVYRKDHSLYLSAQTNLAAILWKQQRVEEAKHLYTTLLDTYKECETMHVFARGACLKALGVISDYEEDTSPAVEYYEEALKCFESLGNKVEAERVEQKLDAIREKQ